MTTVKHVTNTTAARNNIIFWTAFAQIIYFKSQRDKNHNKIIDTGTSVWIQMRVRGFVPVPLFCNNKLHCIYHTITIFLENKNK